VCAFQIVREREPNVLILRTEGYINDGGGAQLREACESALAENLRNIIIDFESSEHINSVGMANLIAVIERIGETQGRLAFTGLTPTVKEVFDMMGITRHVLIFATAKDARAMLAPPPPATA
jgi:anti-anti-sigma factor